MKGTIYIVVGTIFLALSGFFYTFERVAAILSSAIIDSGYAISSGSTPGGIDYPDFFENFYVWAFCIIGLLLLIRGFIKNREDGRHI